MKKIITILLFCIFILGSIYCRTLISGFKVSDKDEVDQNNKYYGFQVVAAYDEDWYIIHVTTATVRYLLGDSFSDYPTAWDNRTSNTYYEPKDIYANPY